MTITKFVGQFGRSSLKSSMVIVSSFVMRFELLEIMNGELASVSLFGKSINGDRETVENELIDKNIDKKEFSTWV